MKVVCRVCNKEEEGTQDALMDKGWCGVAVRIAGKYANVSWCPEHNQPELTVQFVEKVKRGEVKP